MNHTTAYETVSEKLLERYNTPHYKIIFQSDIESLSFDDFMARNQIGDEKECMKHLVESLNKVTPQQLEGLQTEHNKIR